MSHRADDSHHAETTSHDGRAGDVPAGHPGGDSAHSPGDGAQGTSGHAHGASAHGASGHAHGGGPLRPVEEHRALVSALLPRTDVVQAPLQEARGLVLAEDVIAPISLPPFDNSAMDGYAVRRADLTAVPCTLPVSRDIPAGDGDATPLAPGTAARIMTGAPVPEGADCVIPVELTDGGTATVTFLQHPGERSQIRPMGDDIHAGATVLTQGTSIGAAQIGAAAAVGYAALPVFRPVTVLVLSTGSELAAPGAALAAGQIYESNGQMLAAAVAAAGGVPRLAHFVADDVDAFRRTLADMSAGVDLILTSGGVSAGAYEVVKDALADAGVDFVKVAMQPGMPQGAGRYRGVPVVTLPGNPVSSYVSFEVFVRPALRAAMGMAEPNRPAMRLPLAGPLTSPGGKRQIRRGVIDAMRGTVDVFEGAGSHLLGALAQADSLIIVPEDVTELAAGDEVEVWLLDD